jgi:hypothetical protein
MVLFFNEFVDFTESIHVELAYERLNFAMAKVYWKHFILQDLWIFYVNFRAILTPTDDILELIFLNKLKLYLQNGVDLHDEFRDGYLATDFDVFLLHLS